MKNRNLFSSISLLAMLLMTACSTMQSNYDFAPGTDFSALKTYKFGEKTIPTTQPSQADNPIMIERIKTALSGTLNAKGFAPAAGQPDFVVYFLPASKRVTTTQYVSTGWNYSASFPVTFTEGSLLVDIVDGKTNKMIWRGSVTEALSPNMDPDKIQNVLNAAAKQLFKNFPPPKK
jgi:hypothetical protein